MINVKEIEAEVRKLYAKEYKDGRGERIICTGDVIKTTFTEADVFVLPPNNPIRIASGLPGFPYNSIVQIVGSPDTGKSTIAALTAVEAQKLGAVVIVWDAEVKFDAARFERFGGVAKDLLLIRTNEILKGGELIRQYIHAVKAKDPDVKIFVVWDSVGASQSRSHAERRLDDEKHQQPGQDAKENGSVCKMLAALFQVYPDSLGVLLINQVYDKIGFMQKGWAATGGKKIEFHSLMILHMKREKIISRTKSGVKIKTGIISKLSVHKNHMSQTENSVFQASFLITHNSMTACDSAFKKAEDEIEEVDEGDEE